MILTWNKKLVNELTQVLRIAGVKAIYAIR